MYGVDRMTTKKKPKKNAHKPKVVKVVYVKEKQAENPFSGVNQMVGTGTTAIIGIGLAGAIAKALK